MIRASAVFDQRALATELDRDAVVQHYRAFFALLDWTQISERTVEHPWPGTVPHPEAAYVKALLVKLGEQKAYVTDLRSFLVKHPLLRNSPNYHLQEETQALSVAPAPGFVASGV